MMKKFIVTLVILLIGSMGYLYLSFKEKRTLITPYPYTFTESFTQKFRQSEAQNIQMAQNAKILIVGDRMARSLLAYEKSLQEAFGDSLKSPPSIFNWSSEHEGLHRTLFKLRQLSKVPPLIVYFGASSEIYEQKFDVKNKKAILKNFKTFDDEKIISLIITFPWMSKYFYRKMNYFDLSEPQEYNNNLTSQQKLDEKEISFKLFEYETNELISWAKDKKSNLIFFTTPLNLEVEPKEICSHSTNPDVIGLQQEIEGQIKEGQYKSVYPQIQELAQETYGNAMTFYLLGKAAQGLGDLKTAREAYAKSTVFDCANWRGNAVYNAIIKAQAGKNLLHLVDFEQYMNSQLSSEGLFIDEIYPQTLFYQNMIKELGDILKKILSVNE